MENIFKVSGNTNSQKLASALMKSIQNGDKVAIRCLGASAVNQAIKSLCILRGMGATIGLDIKYYSIFDMDVAQDLTFIKFCLDIKSMY